jgi:hypothetical protein
VLAASLWSAGCVAAIATAFWFEDLRYAAPTPPPPGHRDVPIGAEVGLVPRVAALLPSRAASTGAPRPAVLHFYNPDCTCSRFNLEHLRGLVARFASQVDFVLVVESDDAASAAEVAERVEPDLPWIHDRDGAVADHYGVHATPLAAIVAPDGRLWFRGNYASARFCTDPAKEYARVALEALLAGAASLDADVPSQTYGCPLPSDEVPP